MTNKPTNRAFVLSSDKAEAFFNNKDDGTKKVLERFFAHQPKEDVQTPYKKEKAE